MLQEICFNSEKSSALSGKFCKQHKRCTLKTPPKDDNRGLLIVHNKSLTSMQMATGNNGQAFYHPSTRNVLLLHQCIRQQNPLFTARAFFRSVTQKLAQSLTDLFSLKMFLGHTL